MNNFTITNLLEVIKDGRGELARVLINAEMLSYDERQALHLLNDKAEDELKLYKGKMDVVAKITTYNELVLVISDSDGGYELSELVAEYQALLGYTPNEAILGINRVETFINKYYNHF